MFWILLFLIHVSSLYVQATFSNTANYIGSSYPSPFGYRFGTGGLIRSSFSTATITSKISTAFVTFAVNGIAEIYINGQRIGGSEFAPGRRVLDPALTQYEQRMFYVSINVTDLLNANGTTNNIGIVLGRGHWGHYEYGKVGILLQLQVNHQIVLETNSFPNNTWYTTPSPIQDDDLFNGEFYNGSLAQELGWSSTFAKWSNETEDPTNIWKPISTTSEYNYSPTATNTTENPQDDYYYPPILTNQEISIPPTVTSAPRQPIAIHWMNSTAAVVDFGENGAGWSRLEIVNHYNNNNNNDKYSNKYSNTSIPSLQHRTITMEHTEMVHSLTKDVFNQFPCPIPTRVCVQQTNRYIRSKQAVNSLNNNNEMYEPKFVWFGFRYVKVTGCTAIRMPGTATTTTIYTSFNNSFNTSLNNSLNNSFNNSFNNQTKPLSNSSTVTCIVTAIRASTNFTASTTRPSLTFPDAPILTKISNMITRTVLSNQIGYQTSCPTREKVAWNGDTLVTAPTLLLLVNQQQGIQYLRNYVRSLADNFDLSLIR